MNLRGVEACRTLIEGEKITKTQIFQANFPPMNWGGEASKTDLNYSKLTAGRFKGRWHSIRELSRIIEELYIALLSFGWLWLILYCGRQPMTSFMI